jgi:hypothetical protein
MSRSRTYFTWNGYPCEPFTVKDGEEPPVPARLQINTDSHYAGLRATDGTPIDSRTKHRAYMKANNLALADDFKGVWQKAEVERGKWARGELKDKQRHEAMGRLWYDMEMWGRKR